MKEAKEDNTCIQTLNTRCTLGNSIRENIGRRRRLCLALFLWDVQCKNKERCSHYGFVNDNAACMDTT